MLKITATPLWWKGKQVKEWRRTNCQWLEVNWYINNPSYYHQGNWSRGMILASGARGPGFDTYRNPPFSEIHESPGFPLSFSPLPLWKMCLYLKIATRLLCSPFSLVVEHSLRKRKVARSIRAGGISSLSFFVSTKNDQQLSNAWLIKTTIFNSDDTIFVEKLYSRWSDDFVKRGLLKWRWYIRA